MADRRSNQIQTIEPLFKKHEGEDIYVLGSGPTLGFIDSSFFNNKIIVAVNHTLHYVTKSKVLYVISKEPSEVMQRIAKKRGALLVCTLKKCGLTQDFNEISHPFRTYIFDPKQISDIKAGDFVESETLIYSDSTILSGIHLAVFLGAKNVILVGHDCGTIDEKIHVPNYDKTTSQTPEDKYSHWMIRRAIEKQTIEFKEFVKTKWGVNIYSLNPFINYNLEGHTFESF